MASGVPSPQPTAPKAATVTPAHPSAETEISSFRPSFMTPAALRTKALAIEAFLRERLLDAHGVVYTFLDRDTRRPPTESLFPPAAPGMDHHDFYIEGYTRPEFAAYENCGMTTGAYLQALVAQYRAEGDPAVRAHMAGAFEALRHIYRLGTALEEGFFPKIYGGRFSPQTSTDQALYAALALDRYYDVATPGEQREIARMIPRMVNFWMARRYAYPYYENADKHWPLQRFPPLLLLAWRYSGEAAFKAEYDRLLAQGVSAEPEFAQLRKKRSGTVPLSAYERQHGAFLISAMSCGAAMDWMHFDALLRHDPTHALAPDWKAGMRTMWGEARITLAPNGKHYMQVLVDMESGSVRRPAGFAAGDQPGCTSGWSTFIASGAVLAAPHLPDPTELRQAVAQILERLNLEDLTYFDDADRFPPRFRFKTRFLSGDAVANWLWAYWQGRCNGVLASP